MIVPVQKLMEIDTCNLNNLQLLYTLGLRIVGGDNSNGRLEICYGGEWGTICDDNFGIDEANIACNQLGFMGAWSAYTGGTYGEGCGPIFLDDLSCVGDENTLDACYHLSVGTHNCEHSEDVAVSCNTGGELNHVVLGNALL